MNMSLQKPTDELGRSYVSFMRVSLDQIRQKVADELYILTLFEASRLLLWDWWLLEVCGYTRTCGFTRLNPYPRVRVGAGNRLLVSGRVAKTVYPQTPSDYSSGE